MPPNEELAGTTTTKQPRTGRKTRVKSGCATCKSRRVKCDEGRPACERCLESGRVCEGYGIWGGGGNAYGSDLRKFMSIVSHAYEPFTRQRLLVLRSRVSSDEGTSFDFFRNRTSVKLPGMFGSEFWETVVFQVSSVEPAVLHATIALASLQRSNEYQESVKGGGAISTLSSAPDAAVKWNRFALQQYNKAIAYLKPHFSAHNHRSLQVTLVTCMIFTCIEILQGQYTTAHKLVQGGLGLVYSLKVLGATHNINAMLQMDSMDLSLVEAFSRLNIQSPLFSFPTSYFKDKNSEETHMHLPDIPSSFATLQEARQSLDELFSAVIQLNRAVAITNYGYLSLSPNLTISPAEQAAQLLPALTTWLYSYNASLPIIEPKLNPRSSLGVPLLRIYYVMISIIFSTCVDQFTGGNEMVYDTYTPEFASIVTQTLAFSAHSDILRIKYGPSTQGISTPEGQKFTADLGIIAPLFYTAVKCRVPWLRRQAISCLLTAPHREAFWDGGLAAAAAQKIKDLEERGFYEAGVVGVSPSGEFPPPQGHSARAAATLPETHRFHEVQVLLEDKYQGAGRVVCRRKRMDSELGVWRQDGDWEVMEDWFNLLEK
ncbi:hypothetical protein VF21_02239 [Pseudogymnoascus sp. 05NY08]|nr:hypothetical protein VF21_02239 [Pseudogymnoascus sp. 05NY08]